MPMNAELRKYVTALQSEGIFEYRMRCNADVGRAAATAAGADADADANEALRASRAGNAGACKEDMRHTELVS